MNGFREVRQKWEDEGILPLENALKTALLATETFAVLLCADTVDIAKEYREIFSSAFFEFPQPNVTEFPLQIGMEESILFGTADHKELADMPEKLLQFDFVVCIADEQTKRSDVHHLIQRTDGMLWIVSEQESLWEAEAVFTYGNGEILNPKKLARMLHGLICSEGPKVRRKFRRHAAMLNCKCRKRELSGVISLLQERYRVQYEKQSVYFRKFVYIWNELDNGLSDRGDYLQLLDGVLEQCHDPISFKKESRDLLCQNSREYFVGWQQRFLHSIPGSAACGRIADDFYRIVLDQAVTEPVCLGNEPKRWWNKLFFIPVKPRYDDYVGKTAALWREQLVSRLRDELKKLLAAYEQEFRARTVYPDLEPYAKAYTALMELEDRIK